MKKILLSFLTVIGVTSLVAAGTRAVFTDTESSVGNILGVENHFEVVLDGKNNFGNRVSERFFNVTNLIPTNIDRDHTNNLSGWEKSIHTAYLEVKNNSNMPMLFRAYADKVNDPNGLRHLIKVKVTFNPEDYATLYQGSNLYGGTKKDTVLGTWTLEELKSKDVLNNIQAARKDGWPLPAGFVAVYKLEVFLDLEAGNNLQGKQVTADLVVDATQYEGQDLWNVKW